MPTPPQSPPLTATTNAKLGQSIAARRGGAAFTIAGECERLFCETLRSVFLVEGNTVGQDSLAVGVHTHSSAEIAAVGGNDTPGNNGGAVMEQAPDGFAEQRGLVKSWIEVWDYKGGSRFRCFVVEDKSGRKTMFVFFDEEAVRVTELKPGLMAVLELADHPSVSCEEVVVCIDREFSEKEKAGLIKSLGWVGFEPKTLEEWTNDFDIVSKKWMFMGIEV